MRRAGADSWRFAHELGQLPHAVLYVRDALRLPVEPAEDIPPRLVGEVPDRSELLTSSARTEAGRQWAAWWRAEVDIESRAQLGLSDDHEGCGRISDSATSPSLAGDSVLRPAAQALFGEGCQWADTARQPMLPPALGAAEVFDWALIRDTAEAVAAEAGVEIGTINGAASVLLVEGVWWALSAAQFALCSVAATQDPDLAEDILREAFLSGLSLS